MMQNSYFTNVFQFFLSFSVILDAPPVPNQIPKNCLGRIANRARQRSRPRHPGDLDFTLAMEHVPKQFVKPIDISLHGGSERHLLFFTEEQLKLLQKARQWFVDGTFKVHRKCILCLLFFFHVCRKYHCMVKYKLLFICMAEFN